MIDAVSRDVHEDMNIAMRAGRIATGERAATSGPRIASTRRRKSDP
jgi:hypothetical protein